MIKERQKNNSTSGSVGGSSSAGDAPKLSRNRGRHKGNPKEKSSKYKACLPFILSYNLCYFK